MFDGCSDLLQSLTPLVEGILQRDMKRFAAFALKQQRAAL